MQTGFLHHSINIKLNSFCFSFVFVFFCFRNNTYFFVQHCRFSFLHFKIGGITICSSNPRLKRPLTYSIINSYRNNITTVFFKRVFVVIVSCKEFINNVVVIPKVSRQDVNNLVRRTGNHVFFYRIWSCLILFLRVVLTSYCTKYVRFMIVVQCIFKSCIILFSIVWWNQIKEPVYNVLIVCRKICVERQILSKLSYFFVFATKQLIKSSHQLTFCICTYAHLRSR